MRPLRNLVSCLFILLAMSAGSIAQARGGDCFGRLREPLEKGGYVGGFDCAYLHIHIKKLGVIAIGQKYYRIYSLKYHFKPVPGNMNTHWGQRLIIFDKKGDYIGEYGVLFYLDNYYISSNSIIYKGRMRGDVNKIVITRAGLPKTVELVGDTVDFQK